jgi:hypothetical protein
MCEVEDLVDGKCKKCEQDPVDCPDTCFEVDKKIPPSEPIEHMPKG